MQEISIDGRTYKAEKGATPNTAIVNGQAKSVDLKPLGNGRFHLLVDGNSHDVEVVEAHAQNPVIKVNGRVYTTAIKSETDLLLERMGINTKYKKEVKELKAPMPGLVVAFRVGVGDEVKAGDPLVVLEAMKMENILKSPTNAKVKTLNANKGDAIEKNTVLITFE